MVKFIKSIYDWGINVLLSSPFKWIYIALCHGLTHIILLLVVGWLAFNFYTRNQDKLKDTVKHTIWVKVGALSRQSDENGTRNKVDMNTLKLKLTLNSDFVEENTDGKYRDALEMTIIPPAVKQDSLILPECSDTIKVCLLRQPYKSDVMVKVDDTYPVDSDGIYMIKSRPIPIEPISKKDSAGICVFNTTLTERARIPVIGQWLKGRSFTIYSNDFNVGNSPYFLYNIRFDVPDPNLLDSLSLKDYSLDIVLDDSQTYSEEFGFYSEKQFIMHSLEPKPDLVDANCFSYFTRESLEAIRKSGGVTLYAEDLKVSNENKQEEFLNSVLTGTCLAFMLDILVQLVIKLRRLHQTRKRKEIKKSDQGSTTD